jgi:predicted O-methyltransferase YrrM
VSTFTVDWFGPMIPIWEEHVVPRISKIPHARWLEVGCYEGRSALWTLDHVLVGPGLPFLYCVDPFHDPVRAAQDGGVNPDYAALFDENLRGRHNVVKIRAESRDALPQLRPRSFSGAYVDGDHQLEAVREDLRLVWDLLVPGGLLVADDYEPGKHQGVVDAVDEHLTLYPDAQVLHRQQQVVVVKR